MSADAPRPAQRDSVSGNLLATWSRQYRGALLNFFRRRMPASADCEDLVQETFTHLAHRQDLADIQNVDRYLFHAAGNVLTDWRRRQATHAAGAHQPITDDLEDAGLTPERVLTGRDALRVLIDALETLPVNTRTIFMLYHFEEMPHAEIGRRMGIAIRTVEDHVARANKRILAVMRERS